jgi:cytochrome P450
MNDCRRTYGETFTLRLSGIGTLVLFTQPEAIKQIFTADTDVLRAGEAQRDLEPLLGRHSVLMLDGAAHLRERRLMMPPFHGERMHAYALAMRDFADDVIDTWRVAEPMPLQRSMQRITLSVILSAVYGYERGPRFDEIADQITRTVNAAMTPWVLLPFFQRSFFGLTPWDKYLREAERGDRMLFDEIARRRRSDDMAKRSDILSLLMSARYDDGSPMSDQELRDELLTLLVAGHETSATALSWAFERVLNHPEVLAKARAELDTVVGDGPLSPEHLPRLEYFDAILKETLRLRPILPIVVRKVHSPIEIGGWQLPAGVTAAPCIYLAARDPRSFPEPERFRPERFVGTKTDPYTWLPFGGGVRRCLGMAFAQYEMKIVLAETLLRVRMRLERHEPAKLTRRAITLVPGGGTRVVVEHLAPRRAETRVARSESRMESARSV